MTHQLKVVAGEAGTLRGYYTMLERIQLELQSGLRALPDPAAELFDMSSDAEVLLENMKTIVVTQAMISGELKW